MGGSDPKRIEAAEFLTPHPGMEFEKVVISGEIGYSDGSNSPCRFENLEITNVEKNLDNVYIREYY
jgi:hypothetical protein